MTKEIDIKKLLEENEELKKKLDDKEVEEKKVSDPMGGPGELCQAWKVSLGEAWQVRRVQSQDGREMVLESVPDGYQVRKGANGYYIVGFEDKDPQKCPYIPNCRSKYTKEYTYKMKKPADSKFGAEPPKGKIYLCEHHANVLIGK